MKHSLYKTKKPLDRSPAVVSLIFRSQVILNYLTESVVVVAAAESTEVESAAESTTAVSESAVAVFWAVLLPHDAKEIAAIATNIKTNFFIFFAF